MEEVIDCIVKEFALRQSEVQEPISTIYIGGGTPSILTADALKRLVSSFPAKRVEEFTIEANPEDVTLDKVKSWVELGINRVSMGVQSMVDEELKVIGRRHSVQDAIDAVDILKKGGIDNFSLDLIYGLPTQTLQSWNYSLSSLLDLNPRHFSAYMLSYEPRTRLTSMLKAGKIEAVDEDTCLKMYDALIHEAKERGYEHYEISNFAHPGFRAVHNSRYWVGTPYIGLGPSAHSYDGKTRRYNPSSIAEYVGHLSLGQVAYEAEKESRAERFNDMIITRLRTAEGVNFIEVPISYRRQLLCDAYRHILDGSIEICGDYLRIPESSWMLSDAIIRDLLAVT